jgi:hypothetical protein
MARAGYDVNDPYRTSNRLEACRKLLTFRIGAGSEMQRRAFMEVPNEHDFVVFVLGRFCELCRPHC